MMIRIFITAIFCTLSLISTTTISADALPDPSPEFLKFFSWMESEVLKTQARNVDPYDLHKVMGYMLRKQMEQHNVYSDIKSQEDQEALSRLNKVYNDYFFYCKNMATEWNRQNIQYGVDQYTDIFMKYFQSAFRGTDFDQGPGFNFDQSIEQKWGNNPNAVPEFEKKAVSVAWTDIGFEQFLGRYKLDIFYPDGNTSSSGEITLDEAIAVSGHGRTGFNLPPPATSWRYIETTVFHMITQEIWFFDDMGNKVMSLTGPGLSGTYTFTDQNGNTRIMSAHLTRLQ